jgi:arylsulfatase A-like enzyme
MLRLDRDVGRVLARLQELGLERDTLVLFTGDNGAHQEEGKDNAFFAASGPFRGIKRDLYEGGIREPFFARWPGRIAAGTTSDQVVAFWDFPATALEIAGQARPSDLPAEGISFAPTLFGRKTPQAAHDFLYWEILIKNQARQAVREGHWKALRYGLDSPVQLYDLAVDPAEANNLADQHPAIAARLAARFVSARTENPDFPLHSAKPPKVKK